MGTLTETTSTVTPACTALSRESCSQVSCGPTESCSATATTTTSDTDTGGCTQNTGRTTTCAYGTSSCGLGTGCVSQDNTYTRYCGTTYPTVGECQTAHPTWYACQTYTDTSYVTNSEGQTVYTSTTQVRCKEDLTYYRCDAADNYTCPATVQSCTKCPDDMVDTATTGSAIYASPISGECQKNGIILLSDGKPTENQSADLIRTMVGTYAQGCQNAPSPGTEVQVYGRCGPELAKFLATEDQADGSTSTANIPGIQNVNTHTIGLSLGVDSDVAVIWKILLIKEAVHL